MKVKVSKLTDNDDTFNTKLPFEGTLMSKLIKGNHMLVAGGEYGGIYTSMIESVQEVVEDQVWDVWTLNSVYRLEKV